MPSVPENLEAVQSLSQAGEAWNPNGAHLFTVVAIAFVIGIYLRVIWPHVVQLFHDPLHGLSDKTNLSDLGGQTNV